MLNVETWNNIRYAVVKGFWILYQEQRITYIVPGLKALDTMNLEHRITYIVLGLKV